MCFINSNILFSSNVIEVMRTVSNFYFFTKTITSTKKHKKHKKHKNANKRISNIFPLR